MLVCSVGLAYNMSKANLLLLSLQVLIQQLLWLASVGRNILLYYSWLYRPIWGCGGFFQFLNLTDSRTVGRPPCAGNQSFARPLCTQDNTNRINTDNPCFEWVSYPRSKCFSLGSSGHWDRQGEIYVSRKQKGSSPTRIGHTSLTAPPPTKTNVTAVSILIFGAILSSAHPSVKLRVNTLTHTYTNNTNDLPVHCTATLF
jgi:hypothetical protein